MEINTLTAKCNVGCEESSSNQSTKHLPITIAAAITICLLVGLIVEQEIFNGIEIHKSLSVFTVLVSVAFVTLAVMMNIVRQTVKPAKRQKVSGVLNVGIYIIHVFVLSVINCFGVLNNGLIKTILCFCISVCLVTTWEKANILRKKNALPVR